MRRELESRPSIIQRQIIVGLDCLDTTADAANPNANHRCANYCDDNQEHSQDTADRVVAIRSSVLGLQRVQKHAALTVRSRCASGAVGDSTSSAASLGRTQEIAQVAVAAGDSAGACGTAAETRLAVRAGGEVPRPAAAACGCRGAGVAARAAAVAE